MDNAHPLKGRHAPQVTNVVFVETISCMKTSWLINLLVSQLIKYTHIGLRLTCLCHNTIMANISCSGTRQTADPLPPGPAVCGVMCASSVHSHSRQQRA